MLYSRFTRSRKSLTMKLCVAATLVAVAFAKQAGDPTQTVNAANGHVFGDAATAPGGKGLSGLNLLSKFMKDKNKDASANDTTDAAPSQDQQSNGAPFGGNQDWMSNLQKMMGNQGNGAGGNSEWKRKQAVQRAIESITGDEYKQMHTISEKENRFRDVIEEALIKNFKEEDPNLEVNDPKKYFELKLDATKDAKRRAKEIVRYREDERIKKYLKALKMEMHKYNKQPYVLMPPTPEEFKYNGRSALHSYLGEPKKSYLHKKQVFVAGYLVKHMEEMDFTIDTALYGFSPELSREEQSEMSPEQIEAYNKLMTEYTNGETLGPAKLWVQTEETERINAALSTVTNEEYNNRDTCRTRGMKEAFVRARIIEKMGENYGEVNQQAEDAVERTEKLRVKQAIQGKKSVSNSGLRALDKGHVQTAYDEAATPAAAAAVLVQHLGERYQHAHTVHKKDEKTGEILQTFPAELPYEEAQFWAEKVAREDFVKNHIAKVEYKVKLMKRYTMDKSDNEKDGLIREKLFDDEHLMAAGLSTEEIKEAVESIRNNIQAEHDAKNRQNSWGGGNMDWMKNLFGNGQNPFGNIDPNRLKGGL